MHKNSTLTQKIKAHFESIKMLDLGLNFIKTVIILLPILFCAVSVVMIILSYARFAWLGLVLILTAITLCFLEICLKSENEFENKLGQRVRSFFEFWTEFWIRFRPPFQSRVRSDNRSSKERVHQAFLRFGKVLFYSVFLSLGFVGIFAINLPESAYNSFPISLLPTAIIKPSSNFFHAMRTFASIEVLKNNPDKFWLGYGLGISGPAAKMSYYNIKEQALFRDNEAVAYRYRLVGEDLSIPENWYIQTIFNGGFFYAILYLVLVSYPVWMINRTPKPKEVDSSSLNFLDLVFQKKLIITGFVAILLGNLFLHIFESSVVFGYFVIISILFLVWQKSKV